LTAVWNRAGRRFNLEFSSGGYQPPLPSVHLRDVRPEVRTIAHASDLPPGLSISATADKKTEAALPLPSVEIGSVVQLPHYTTLPNGWLVVLVVDFATLCRGI
jgi:hypothetical protein